MLEDFSWSPLGLEKHHKMSNESHKEWSYSLIIKKTTDRLYLPLH